MSATILRSVRLPASSAADSGTTSSRAVWAGRTLSALGVLFLTVDTVGKLIALGPVVEATVQLGFAPDYVVIIGLVELLCLSLYLVPRTAVLGAILWTGYFGGAIATHLRLDNPLFSHTLFPIYIAALLWGGLYLRDSRVRALLRSPR